MGAWLVNHFQSISLKISKITVTAKGACAALISRLKVWVNREN
jgi:hypothetical protein